MSLSEAWHTTFEPSGDLLTNGALGVWRWPVQVSNDRNEFQSGPPRQLPLPGGRSQIANDRSGEIVALANRSEAYVLTPDRQFRAAPSTTAAASRSARTANGWRPALKARGVRVWRIRDGTKAKKLPIDYGTGVLFSPDAKWLLTQTSPCRLWAVGTWEEARQISGTGHCFSPQGCQLLVQDADMGLRLVETETGRTLARLESPDASRRGLRHLQP